MKNAILVAVVVFLLAALGTYVKFVQHNALLTGDEMEADARAKRAFQSLTDRLPKGKPIKPTKALTVESKKRWEIFDQDLASRQDKRAELLKALHERTRRYFVESPGAGSERPIFRPEAFLMDDYLQPINEPYQPGGGPDFPVSPGEGLTRVAPNDEFHFYHEIGMHDFLDPTGFGYVKDRAHVAGFKPHGFRYLRVPVQESRRWRIDHIQLLGILSQAEPVVYLTDKLPSMEQIRQGKTRELDFFEKAALPSLFEGEDLYIVRQGDTLRMLGALRATKTCQQCHDAETGDLLGAFSYALRPAPGVAADDNP